MEQIETRAMNIDAHIKGMVERPTRLDESYQPGISYLKEAQGHEESKKPVILPTNRVNAQGIIV